MERRLKIINGATIAGALFLLAASVWPQALRDWRLLLVLLPLILLLGLAWVVVVWLGTRPTSVQLKVRPVLLAPVIVCLTFAMLRFYIPRRVAFAACLGQFRAHVDAAPVSQSPQPFGQRLGLYHVDRYAAHPLGGVYFRTGTTAGTFESIGESCGFAYQPNRDDSPFGREQYRLYRLFGEWYWFRASDDR